MLVVETLAVGALFGGIGSALGVGVVAIMRFVGIPASNDTLYFLFSGPRLHPGLSPINVTIALTIVLLVSGASSLYPGFLAMRVSPRQAMQSDE
jgi:ABC-type antimicrobial peptide transport system permease subunit